MPELEPSVAHLRRRRRWVFADCVFDEANWALVVNGQRISIESKPLELLRELLNRAGNLVSKQELLDSVWPNVTVVEASLTTAVRKLRIALNDDQRPTPLIETVPRMGYRLSIPVEIDDGAGGTRISWAASGDLRRRKTVSPSSTLANSSLLGSGRPLSIWAGIAILCLIGVLAAGLAHYVSAAHTKVSPSFTQRDVANALRKLDVGAIETMLAAGWDPNKSFDNQGNGALNIVLNNCEWDRGLDQEQMVLMVRTLVDGGARLDHRNVWGDTPYSIAKAIRYCGPNHPVTRSIRTMCYGGYKPLGDRCLASYELSHR